MKSRTSAALAGLLSTSMFLTACGEPDQDDGGAAPAEEQTDAAVEDEYNDADVDYVAGMILHHEQAVEMSDILLAKDDSPQEVSDLAEDIREAQQPEIDQMEAWLDSWGEQPEADANDGDDDHADHEGMTGGEDDHAGHEGMMSDEDIEDLESAEGDEASRLFLEQMIAHHEGAVSMAEEHLDTGENPEALELSEEVIADQSAEIEEMESMLETL